MLVHFTGLKKAAVIHILMNTALLPATKLPESAALLFHKPENYCHKFDRSAFFA
jgi:hypothetical protein